MQSDDGAETAGPELTVEFFQRFTVKPPEGIDDPVYAEDWFWNIYPEIGYDVVDPRKKEHYEVVATRGMGDDEHIPQTSADPFEYTDARGIKVADSEWSCPNCGDDGELMHRPGSKNTCTRCFWVVGGPNNDFVLEDHGITYREGQRRLAEAGRVWYGTPGDVSTRLRSLLAERRRSP